MNTPLQRIGKHEGQPVYNLNGQQVKLGYGFNPSPVYLGHDEQGRPRFAPTRRQRRSGLQKANRRIAYGYQKRYQHEWNQAGKPKTIVHAIIAKQTGHGGANF